jgi:hypothetical protein
MIIYERAGIYPPSEGDVPIHCLYCGWTPIEGMKEYLSIHADKADCIRCKRLLPHDPPFIDPYEDSNEGGDGMTCATENQLILAFIGLGITQIIIWISLVRLICERTALKDEAT